jgi:lysophospholipase L1-like esterase
MAFFQKILFGASLVLSTGPAPAQVTAVPPVAPATIVASDSNYARDFKYQTQFADYLVWRRHQPVDLIFIGDSITEQFRWGFGNPVWKQYFEERALDFGKGGDRTQHVLWRLEHQDVSWVNPKAAVLLIGTNNQEDSPENIALGIKTVIRAMQAKWPNAKILLLSILPNARQTERMAAANKLLPAIADQTQVQYIDVTSLFPRDGENWKGLQGDKLHLTTQGYEGLASAINAALAKLTK